MLEKMSYSLRKNRLQQKTVIWGIDGGEESKKGQNLPYTEGMGEEQGVSCNC